MSTKAQLSVSVPSGTAYNPVARLTSNGKVGRITVRLTQTLNFNNQSQPVAAGSTLFYFYESDNGSTWGDPLNDTPVEVVAGGVQIATLNIRKSHVKVSAVTSDGKGSSVRIDLDYDGSLYHGQLELSQIGKSGYGLDGGSGHAEGTGSISDWPGASSVADEEVSSPP